MVSPDVLVHLSSTNGVKWGRGVPTRSIDRQIHDHVLLRRYLPTRGSIVSSGEMTNVVFREGHK